MNHNKGREDAPRKNKGERDEMKGKKEEGKRERHGRAREVSADQTGAPFPPTQASEPGSAKIQPQRTEAEHASSFHFRPSDPGASRKPPHLHSLHGSHPPLLPPTSPRPGHSRPPIKIAPTTGRCCSQASTLHRDKGGRSPLGLGCSWVLFLSSRRARSLLRWGAARSRSRGSRTRPTAR